ncbi:MAG: hypothetical protein CL771_04550 [Chloroflexi bacterium]|nr:hypothetical protein [Chloroflexota bacterium]|tara:strand:- start:905 stop:1255 length:351 start_codon:yes stop_codon:yes gene_type:complete
MSQDLNIDRMALMVVDEADADLLSDALVEAEFRVTRIGSTGGFLRRGSTTLMCGINGSQVDRLLVIVKEHCEEREEMVPLQGLPLAGDAAFSSRIVQIRTGGAVIFVLPVERFFKT